MSTIVCNDGNIIVDLIQCRLFRYRDYSGLQVSSSFLQPLRKTTQLPTSAFTLLIAFILQPASTSLLNPELPSIPDKTDNRSGRHQSCLSEDFLNIRFCRYSNRNCRCPEKPVRNLNMDIFHVHVSTKEIHGLNILKYGDVINISV